MVLSNIYKSLAALDVMWSQCVILFITVIKDRHFTSADFFEKHL